MCLVFHFSADIKNAIQVAAKIMTHTEHCILAGEAATKFAESQGFIRAEAGSLATKWAEKALEMGRDNANELGEDYDDEKGTVGAVALDARGNLSAATSTGGMSGKLSGRVGDSAILGAGVYADDKGKAIFVS